MISGTAGLDDPRNWSNPSDHWIRRSWHLIRSIRSLDRMILGLDPIYQIIEWDGPRTWSNPSNYRIRRFWSPHQLWFSDCYPCIENGYVTNFCVDLIALLWRTMNMINRFRDFIWSPDIENMIDSRRACKCVCMYTVQLSPFRTGSFFALYLLHNYCISLGVDTSPRVHSRTCGDLLVGSLRLGFALHNLLQSVY